MLDKRSDQFRFNVNNFSSANLRGYASEFDYGQLHSARTTHIRAEIDDNIGALAQTLAVDQVQWLIRRTMARAAAQLVLIVQPPAADKSRIAKVCGCKRIAQQIFGMK